MIRKCFHFFQLWDRQWENRFVVRVRGDFYFNLRHVETIIGILLLAYNHQISD